MRIFSMVLAAILMTGVAEAKTLTFGSSDCKWTTGSYKPRPDWVHLQGSTSSGHYEDPLTMTGCGFTYQTAGSYDAPPGPALHDDGGGAVASVFASLGGMTFSLTKAVIAAFPHVYFAGNWADGETPTEEELRGELVGYKNVGLYGYRNEKLVSSLVYFDDETTSDDVDIGDDFKDIDTLVLQLILPDEMPVFGRIVPADDGQPMWFDSFNLPEGQSFPRNQTWCEYEYCGTIYAGLTISFDEPAQVPVPASLPLTIAGLVMIAGIASRRRMTVLKAGANLE